MSVPTDSEIIKELVDELMIVQRTAPFEFGIYYDAKKEPARVTVHSVVKNGTMGTFKTMIPRAARDWVEDALREGYTVARIIGRDDSYQGSLSRRRQSHEWKSKRAAMTPQQIRDEEDEIPF